MRPRRLSTRILAGQLVVLLVAVVSGFLLFTRELRNDIDRSYEDRALSIAEAAGNNALIRTAMAAGDRHDEVQSIAESLRKATGASYIVVIDRNSLRHSHPNPAL